MAYSYDRQLKTLYVKRYCIHSFRYVLSICYVPGSTGFRVVSKTAMITLFMGLPFSGKTVLEKVSDTEGKYRPQRVIYERPVLAQGFIQEVAPSAGM